ncbi:MAG: hypothetical protein K0V04_15565 [Deltaproteobacteria bacterium]|nr:hypothetical protein [Deltaproteobacteria bacterium]
MVEKIGPRRYSIAHYFEQHGDLVPDPDLEFVRQDGEWFPAAATMAIGSYTRAVETDQDGKITGVRRRAYAGLRSFAGTLLTNIKAQQRPLVPTSTEGDE